MWLKRFSDVTLSWFFYCVIYCSHKFFQKKIIKAQKCGFSVPLHPFLNNFHFCFTKTLKVFFLFSHKLFRQLMIRVSKFLRFYGTRKTREIRVFSWNLLLLVKTFLFNLFFSKYLRHGKLATCWLILFSDLVFNCFYFKHKKYL